MARDKASKSSKKKQGLRRGKTKSSQSNQEEIMIDPDKNLIFKNDDELYDYFQEEILVLEEEFYKKYSEENDIAEENFDDYEEFLLETLSQPDYIYESHLIKDKPVQHFVKVYESTNNNDVLYYVAIAYVVDENPTFVYMHFPTQSKELCEHFEKGNLIFDAQEEYEQGDALRDGDELAAGLYNAMLKIRSDKDIPEEKFDNYRHYRDESIEEPDEIWRDPDLQGNVLVTFIKDFSNADEALFYISVAVEDKSSDSHLLLFSFPTNDKSLVERYKHGENLHADESEISDSH